MVNIWLFLSDLLIKYSGWQARFQLQPMNELVIINQIPLCFCFIAK